MSLQRAFLSTHGLRQEVHSSIYLTPSKGKTRLRLLPATYGVCAAGALRVITTNREAHDGLLRSRGQFSMLQGVLLSFFPVITIITMIVTFGFLNLRLSAIRRSLLGQQSSLISKGKVLHVCCSARSS